MVHRSTPNTNFEFRCHYRKVAFGAQTPLTVVQPGYTAATYTDTSCIVAKQLTPSSTEVLYSGGPDITFATVAEWLASFQAPGEQPPPLLHASAERGRARRLGALDTAGHRGFLAAGSLQCIDSLIARGPPTYQCSLTC